MKRLSTQAAIIGLGRLLNMAAAAGTMMVLARIMPDKESYGAIFLLILLYVMLSQIFSVGLPQAVFYFLPRYSGGEQRGFLTQILILLIASGMLLGAGLFFGANALGHFLGSPKLPAMLKVFALYPIFMMPTLALEGTLLFHKRPVAIVIYNVAVRVGMFFSLVIPVWLHASLITTIEVWVAEAALMCAIAMSLMFSSVRGLPLVWHRQMLKEVWRFSLPLAALALIAISVGYLDRFIVSHFFGTGAFGVYSNATIEIPTVTMVTSATSVVLLAEFSRLTAAGEFSKVMSVWHQATIKTGILIFASFGFLVYWSHETMQLLFSSRFAESGNIFSIIVWTIPLYLFSMRPLYIAVGSTRTMTFLTLFDLVNTITCITFFGHILGLIGIAFGVVVSTYISVIPWVTIFVRKLTRIGWGAFMPWKKILLAISVALAAGGISRSLHLIFPTEWPMILDFSIGLLTYLVLYASGLYFTQLLQIIIPAKYLPGKGALSRRMYKQDLVSSTLPPVPQRHD